MKVDYDENPEQPYRKIMELGLDPEMPEKIGLFPVPFIRLEREKREKIADFYIHWWNHVLEAEYEVGAFKINTKGMPKKDAIKEEVWEQLRISGRHFPEGQMVLVEKDTQNPIIFTRSQVWHVLEVTDTDRYFREFYPNTWYLVSGDGRGYPWIPTLNGGKLERFMDYDEGFGREGMEHSLDMIISNYALTVNPESKIKGASRAAIVERARFAIDSGIRHCDTCSPLNNYLPWVLDKKGNDLDPDTSPRRFIEENVVIPLNEGSKPPFYTALGMHTHYGARIGMIMPDARIHDKDSIGHCGFCRYF